MSVLNYIFRTGKYLLVIYEMSSLQLKMKPSVLNSDTFLREGFLWFWGGGHYIIPGGGIALFDL